MAGTPFEFISVRCGQVALGLARRGLLRSGKVLRTHLLSGVVQRAQARRSMAWRGLMRARKNFLMASQVPARHCKPRFGQFRYGSVEFGEPLYGTARRGLIWRGARGSVWCASVRRGMIWSSKAWLVTNGENRSSLISYSLACFRQFVSSPLQFAA